MVPPGLRVFTASRASFLTRPGSIEASPFVISRREPCASFLSPCGQTTQCFYFLQMLESTAAFGAGLLSQLKGGTSFASWDPPEGSGELAPIPALVLPGMEVGAGVSVQPASGAETPGHVAKPTFTAHRKHLFPTGSLVLLCNYARLPDISGALGTQPARALLPDMTLELLGFL